MPGRLLYITVVLLVLIGAYQLQVLSASAPKPREKTPQELMSLLVEKLSKGQVQLIELYYFKWGFMTHSVMTQDDLLHKYQYKVVIQSPGRDTEDLQYSLRRFKFRKAEQPELDFRLACIFDMGSDGTVSLFFGVNPPVVSIGGTFFKVDADLLNAVAAFIPHQEYEWMHKAVLREWISTSHYWRELKGNQ
jgi:hypothetical protein